MFSKIKDVCDQLVQNFGAIPVERIAVIEKITAYISAQIMQQKHIQIVYVCTHNSRRSHFGQIWAAVAAEYFEIKNVSTYSGGTEATRFNQNAIFALQEQGFEIEAMEGENPYYEVFFGRGLSSLCFSKVVHDAYNPTENFAAVMTCTDAEQNCPFIAGADQRIGLTYDDPKAFDDTAQQNEKYTERSKQIALECLYVFSKVRPNAR
jgi:arsenate reductase (thioredoxin)